MKSLLHNMFILAKLCVLEECKRLLNADFVELVRLPSTGPSERFRRELKAQIIPPLDFSEQGSPINTASDNMYVVTLVINAGISFEEERAQSSTVLDYSRHLNALITSVVGERNCRTKSRTNLRRHYHPSTKKVSGSDFYETDLFQSSEREVTPNSRHISGSPNRLLHGEVSNSNRHWDAEEHYSRIFEGDTYYTGWKLSWASLQKWIERKELRVTPIGSSIDPQVYITKSPGLYSFSWSKDHGFYLHFGDDRGKTGDYAHEEGHRKVTLLGEEYFGDLKFDPSEEATILPKEAYSGLQKALEKSGFKPRVDRRYEGDCEEIDKLMKAINCEPYRHCLIINLKESYELRMFYKKFLLKNGDTCIVDLIEGTESLVLGCSFLKAYSVFVNTKGETRTFELGLADPHNHAN